VPRLLHDTFAASPIQAIELGTPVTVAIGNTSSNYALDGVKLVRVSLSEDCWIRFVEGAAGTVSPANGHFFPKGVEVFVVPQKPGQQTTNTHMAIISAAGNTGHGSLTPAI
jgi:hypothetical protein